MREPRLTTLTMGVVAALVLCLISSATLSREMVWSVPSDRSLTIDSYRGRGVPDPERPWDGEAYKRALDVLIRMDRHELPRYRSERSGLLFERIVTSDHLLDATTERTLVSKPEGVSVWARTLYERRASDGLLFDSEMVAIQMGVLKRVLEVTPSDARLTAQYKEYVERMRRDHNTSDEEVAQILREAERVAGLPSAVVHRELSSLLSLLLVDELRDEARKLLARDLGALIERIAAYLSETDAADAAAWIRSLSKLERNSVVREELLLCADELDSSLQAPSGR